MSHIWYVISLPWTPADRLISTHLVIRCSQSTQIQNSIEVESRCLPMILTSMDDRRNVQMGLPHELQALPLGAGVRCFLSVCSGTSWLGVFDTIEARVLRRVTELCSGPVWFGFGRDRSRSPTVVASNGRPDVLAFGISSNATPSGHLWASLSLSLGRHFDKSWPFTSVGLASSRRRGEHCRSHPGRG